MHRAGTAGRPRYACVPPAFTFYAYTPTWAHAVPHDMALCFPPLLSDRARPARYATRAESTQTATGSPVQLTAWAASGLTALRSSHTPTVYTHAGSWSTTGIEPDSVPTARLPESEPEPCHTCSRCLVRRKGMERLQGVGRVEHLHFAPCRLSVDCFAARGYLRHMQSSDPSSGIVSDRHTGSQ